MVGPEVLAQGLLLLYRFACLLACLLACLPACLFVCLLACLLACVRACLLACSFGCVFVYFFAVCPFSRDGNLNHDTDFGASSHHIPPLVLSRVRWAVKPYTRLRPRASGDASSRDAARSLPPAGASIDQSWRDLGRTKGRNSCHVHEARRGYRLTKSVKCCDGLKGTPPHSNCLRPYSTPLGVEEAKENQQIWRDHDKISPLSLFARGKRLAGHDCLLPNLRNRLNLGLGLTLTPNKLPPSVAKRDPSRLT